MRYCLGLKCSQYPIYSYTPKRGPHTPLDGSMLFTRLPFVLFIFSCIKSTNGTMWWLLTPGPDKLRDFSVRYFFFFKKMEHSFLLFVRTSKILSNDQSWLLDALVITTSSWPNHFISNVHLSIDMKVDRPSQFGWISVC